ncbi:DEAD/DEAH box helicase [Hazenella coriacea]|uniref:Competence protein ComFA n=1 Tax=Hazenella coriacea TaxID=1179467 RepID=A0A4R3LBG7_9BACL|nr:DEAD/DEAH box helicase family protein [Hazenella coriacea]TCS95644.1 competence protein ComFA [Hazenella coriacea]
MEIFIYRCTDDPKMYLSLAPTVDQMKWKSCGKNIQWLGQTTSMGVAYQWLQGRTPIKSKGVVYPTEEVKGNRGWQEKKERLAPDLSGRALLWQELLSLVQKLKFPISEEELCQIVQSFYLSGEVSLLPGVQVEGAVHRWRCHRCLGDHIKIQLTTCATCGEKCAVCENCILLGKSRTCIPFLLFSDRSTISKPRAVKQVSSIQLTPAQKQVNRSIRQFMSSMRSQLLVWAVTGAGKTELMFEVITELLQQGKKVLWVTPRKDVVMEIAPRLQRSFSGVPIKAYYGGSPDLWVKGEIIVATAHQTWRFYRHFDLAIIDEVDAFPLYQNKGLEQGVLRACKKTAKQILLTATPPSEWKKLVRQGTLDTITLPVRYHGYPLPVPKLHIVRNLWKKIKNQDEIPVLFEFLHQVQETHGQAFLFVPRLCDVKQVILWIATQAPSWKMDVKGVFSRHPEREQTIQAFRNQQTRLLVTTTILERGVTIPHGHVMVIGADHTVFDRRSLIQIAGRVGRSHTYLAGQVWFIANEKTEAQRNAIKETNYLNQLAKKEGFLKKEAYFQ